MLRRSNAFLIESSSPMKIGPPGAAPDPQNTVLENDLAATKNKDDNPSWDPPADLAGRVSSGFFHVVRGNDHHIRGLKRGLCGQDRLELLNPDQIKRRVQCRSCMKIEKVYNEAGQQYTDRAPCGPSS